MSLPEQIDVATQAIDTVTNSAKDQLDRLKAEIDFASRLAAVNPEKQAEWEGLITRALAVAQEQLATGTAAETAVAAAEAILAPIGEVAKQYTVHCVGHAHIDMNWMWNWPETIATTNDTVSTVERLMEEFPTFCFSQSQASVYQIMKDYLPELYDRVKAHVADGRWEVTANQWVEGDKNLASGEILCRQLLYTKRFFLREFGLPYDAVKIDFEPDTFGHAYTLPTILTRGGVRWYYFCRAWDGAQLFWWQGRDGSRVLAFNDRHQWYLGPLTAELSKRVLIFEQETGLKDFLFVYGVGDHGGGPTRRDLVQAVKMDTWPIFPNVKLSTYDAFFTIAEQQAKDLPVHDGEMNFIFEGCYTSQSNIKRANRVSENVLVEAEIAALLGKGLVQMPYPSEALFTGWRHAMFNQFHDILPGSGVHATYEYAQGLFQEILGQTTMIKTRALRAIANRVATAAICTYGYTGCEVGDNLGSSIGAGQGDISLDGAISRRGASGSQCDPFVVFNTTPWTRTEVVTTRLWDRDYADGQIIVKDDTGRTIPVQVVERGGFWGHQFIGVAFPVEQVQGLGYRSYSVARSVAPPAIEAPCRCAGKGVIENEFYRIEVESTSGAIVHLIDKRTGIDLVPAGERLGLLELEQEAPHGMTAWIIGQITKRTPLMGGTLDTVHTGPYLSTLRVRHQINDTKMALSISLAASVPRIDFTLDVDWLERGTPETGVPMLRVTFPLNIEAPTATFECPNGWVERQMNGQAFSFTCKDNYSPQGGLETMPQEVPAQKWMDLTGTAKGQKVGATLLNDTKYGHQVIDNTMRLTLLRSSYDPDPLPELGKHTIRFAFCPHVGDWSPAQATREGYAFNLPLNMVGTSEHDGDLPGAQGFAEMLTPTIMLSGIKKAEDSDALIVRLYEMAGQATTARLRLSEVFAAPNAPAVETDLLEQPLATSTARMEGGVLSVDMPAFGLTTVKIS